MLVIVGARGMLVLWLWEAWMGGFGADRIGRVVGSGPAGWRIWASVEAMRRLCSSVQRVRMASPAWRHSSMRGAILPSAGEWWCGDLFSQFGKGHWSAWVGMKFLETGVMMAFCAKVSRVRMAKVGV